MSRISKIAAATMTMALLAAPALAQDVYVFDEWRQPVMAEGAKGGGQALAPAQFRIGVPSSTTNGSGANLDEKLKGSEHWVQQGEISGQPARHNSDLTN